jgi:predicted aminopeptidase
MTGIWKLGLALVVVCTTTSCALPYYMQAIGGQVSLLRQRVPIENIIANPAYDETTRERLTLVSELRAFAVDELGLPQNDSYTSYVDLGRDYVVWNVVAAPEFSVDPMTWCFPVAGCVSYRGYFERRKAESFADRLSLGGFDTFTGGSPAYSTLGHFADPVLNTMLVQSEANIAAMLFHELAHQQVYVRNDTELSESFATAVEQYGVEQWLRSRGMTDEFAQYRQRLERQQDFADLVARQRERLREIFAARNDAASTRLDKAASFELMRAEYEELKSDWGGSGDYDYWFASEPNNASLVAVTSYRRWVPGLKFELERLGPEAFYRAIETLAGQDADERSPILESWNRASGVTALTDRRQLVDSASEKRTGDGLHTLRANP